MFQSAFDKAKALFATLPYWADAAILGVLGLWLAGVIDLTPRDKISDTQIAGIAASLKTVAGKADIAELKAMIAALDKPEPAPAVTTGSISKPSKK